MMVSVAALPASDMCRPASFMAISALPLPVHCTGLSGRIDDVRHRPAGLTSLSGRVPHDGRGTSRCEGHALQPLTQPGYDCTGQPLILLQVHLPATGQRRSCPLHPAPGHHCRSATRSRCPAAPPCPDTMASDGRSCQTLRRFAVTGHPSISGCTVTRFCSVIRVRVPTAAHRAHDPGREQPLLTVEGISCSRLMASSIPAGPLDHTDFRRQYTDRSRQHVRVRKLHFSLT